MSPLTTTGRWTIECIPRIADCITCGLC
jgi:hypothetical protein